MKISVTRRRWRISLGIVAAALMLAISLAPAPLAQTGETQQIAAAIPVSVKWGGMYCRFISSDICYVDFAPKASESNGQINVQGEMANIELSAERREKRETIIIHEDWPLPAEMAKKLGYESGCTLVKGEYRVNYSSNKFGTVEGVKLRGSKS